MGRTPTAEELQKAKWCVVYKPYGWVCSNTKADEIRNFKADEPHCVGSIPLWIVAHLGQYFPFVCENMHVDSGFPQQYYTTISIT